MNYLTLEETELNTKKAYWTAREIAQQPDTLTQTIKIIENDNELTPFLSNLLSTPNIRIILTGAGTSAFIGECIATTIASCTHRRVEAIATTDIVSSPDRYLEKNTPTLVVSFGRSGSSPESVATVDIVDKYVEKTSHLVITCNPDGELSRRAKNSANCHNIILPEATHDQSFAMTSSFTSMMLAAISAFESLTSTGIKDRSDAISSLRKTLEQHTTPLETLAQKHFDRVVWLGSGCFRGLARESALKLLEMTNGDVISTHDTTLAFRHGPKTIVNSNTLVFILISNDPTTRRYDLDLYAELKRDNLAGQVVAIASHLETSCVTPHDAATFIQIPDSTDLNDEDLLFSFIAVAQVYAFFKALSLNKSPDNPNPEGLVNRIVQGVTIYETA